MLAGAEGKRRARRDGGGRPTFRWRTIFLSSGEITLAEKIGQEGGRRRATAGQAVRILDVPADAGVGLGLFEDLHGSPDGRVFAVRLARNAATYHGAPLILLLEKLTAAPDDLANWVNKRRAEFEQSLKLAGADGQVRRAAGRFSLVAAAGELATMLDITGWDKGAAFAAAKTCFEAWLRLRGTTGPLELELGVQQVRKFIEQHGESRFTLISNDINQPIEQDPKRPTVNRAGYRRESRGVTEFLILPEVFKDEVCPGLNAGSIAGELKRRGFLFADADRPSRTTRTERLPGTKGTARVYLLTAKIMEDEDADQDSTATSSCAGQN